MLNKKIPKQIANRYEVLSLMGSGGMSDVYEVKHMVTQERLAIKVIRHKHASGPIDSQTNARFLREASLSQRLKTTGVVKIYDAWIDEYASYMVMERLEGDTLRSMAQKGKITRKKALSYVIQALEIIQEAHEHQIIHRDLKPENLFVCKNNKETTIKLLDFGLSRQSDDFALTHTGYFLGTPWYMSPEQAMNPKECTVISDIWSIGVILYEIFTDQVPFEGETIPLICMHIYKSPHQSLATLNPKIPASLSQLIDQCLEKDPEKRPESAQILAEQLKDELSTHGNLPIFNEIFLGRVPQKNDSVDTQDGIDLQATKDVDAEVEKQRFALKKTDLFIAPQLTPISRSDFETFLDLKRIDTPVDDDDIDDKSTIPLSMDDIQAQLAALQSQDQASQDQASQDQASQDQASQDQASQDQAEPFDFHTYIDVGQSSLSHLENEDPALAATLQPDEKEFYEIKALYQQQQGQGSNTDENPTIKKLPQSAMDTQQLEVIDDAPAIQIIDPLSAQANTIITQQKGMLADQTWVGQNADVHLAEIKALQRENHTKANDREMSNSHSIPSSQNHNKISFLTWIFTLILLAMAVGIWVKKFWQV